MGIEVDDRRVLQLEAFIDEEGGADEDSARRSAAATAEDEEERDRVLEVRMETDEDKADDANANEELDASSGQVGQDRRDTEAAAVKKGVLGDDDAAAQERGK